MDRRGFLKLLASGLIGIQLDLDKLLWQSGAKKIFVPTLKEVMRFNKIPIMVDPGMQRDVLLFYQFNIQMKVDNPAACAKIVNIAEYTR